MRSIRIISCSLVLAALFLTLAIHAQQTRQQESAQPVAASQADYIFADAIPDGTRVGNHKVSHGIHIIGPIAFSETEAAFVAEFRDGANAATGIYTSKGRMVVETGANLDGSIIRQVINTQPGQLQANRAGQVSFIAQFEGRGCGSGVCTGLFGPKLLAVVPTGAATTYSLTDSGQITAPAGSAWMEPAAKKGHGILAAIRERLPVIVTPPVPIYKPLPGTGPVVIQPKTFPLGGQPTQPGQAQKTSLFPVAPAPAACSIPAGNRYPFPQLWPEMASAAGPIGSVVEEGPLWGTMYRPITAPTPSMNWRRRVFFSPSCHVVAISVIQISGPAVEIRTPAGLVGYLDATGQYKFDGVPDVELMPSQNIDEGMRIAPNCSVALPVMFRRAGGEEPGLIIGRPLRPAGHCSE